MTRSELAAVDRRMAIGGVLAGAAGLALPRRQGGTVNQRGMVGGGLAQFDGGEANFSLFASRMELTGDGREVVLGSVLWIDDSAGVTLRSTEITEYIVPEQEGPRKIIGKMSVNDEGEYPFELEVTDADLPGYRKDMLNLKVGNDAATGDYETSASDPEFNYNANGTVVTGDLHDLNFEIDLATGVVRQEED
jgi:hypothetical protein